jgi:hypothetical protein
VVLAGVFRVMFFAVVFAGMGKGFVAMPAMPLTGQSSSTKGQRRQSKCKKDCPNQFLHVVILVLFMLADASFATKVTAFSFHGGDT